MNTTDTKWQSMLVASTPTFAGEAESPFGFVTSTLTRVKMEKRQVEEIERIGWRALLASLCALALAATLTVSVAHRDGTQDFEPGVNSLIQAGNISVS